MNVCNWFRRPSNRQRQSSKPNTLMDKWTIVDEKQAVEGKSSSENGGYRKSSLMTKSKWVTLENRLKIRIYTFMATSLNDALSLLSITVTTRCKICSLKMRINDICSKKNNSTWLDLVFNQNYSIYHWDNVIRIRDRVQVRWV
jgi:hypothetical protein